MADSAEGDVLRERMLLAGATVLLSVTPAALVVAPAPLAALQSRHGLKYGIGVALAASVFASFLALNPIVLAQALLVLALGVAIGEGIRERLSVGTIVSVGAVVTAGSMALLMVMVDRIFHVNPLEMAGEFWEEALSRMMANESALSPEIAAERRALIEQEIAHMRRTFPASLIIGSLVITLTNFSLTRWLLGKFQRDGDMDIPRLAPFGQWRFGMGVGAGFLAAKLLESPAVAKGGWIADVHLNAALLLGMLVAVQGAATAWFFLERRRVGKGFRLLILGGALLFFYQAAALVLVILGLLEMAFDWRGLGRRRIKHS